MSCRFGRDLHTTFTSYFMFLVHKSKRVLFTYVLCFRFKLGFSNSYSTFKPNGPLWEVGRVSFSSPGGGKSCTIFWEILHLFILCNICKMVCALILFFKTMCHILPAISPHVWMDSNSLQINVNPKYCSCCFLMESAVLVIEANNRSAAAPSSFKYLNQI